MPRRAALVAIVAAALAIPTALYATTAATTSARVAITSPANGQTVSGTVTVAVTVPPSIPATRVYILVDGPQLLAIDTAAPYTATWDTTSGANGVWHVSAFARDAAGTAYWASNVWVTVANSAAPRPTTTTTSTSLPRPTTTTVSTTTTSTTAPRRTTTTSTTTTTPTPPPPAAQYACTEVLGFSQTGMWYLAPPMGGGTFEPLVGDAAWQLRAYAGAGVQWQDPSFAGWSAPPYSPCAQHSTNPDRVLLTISTPTGYPTTEWWVSNIQAEITTIRARYSNLRRIILQPVVGGPSNGVCYFNGNPRDPVHASVIHPTIDAAIAQVVGADRTGAVISGASPDVRTCADYADNTGHLCYPGFDACGTLNARGPIGSTIGAYYATH